MTPHAELDEFVRERKPVVITFGSMPSLSPRQVTDMIVDAVSRCGVPAIVQSGIATLGDDQPLPKDMRWVRYVPHGWLLRRAAGIIHHGGAGTCAAALRAGIPQAIVWHLGDQKTWGKAMRRLGVGVPPIFHRHLSREWLTGALERLRSDESLRERSHALRDRIASEDGVARAVEAIDRLQR